MTTTFQLTAGQMIARSLRLIGALPSGGVPSDDQSTQGLIALNLMLKGWQADGVNLFRQTQLSLPVAANQGVPGYPVSIVPLVLAVSEARWVVTPAPYFYERECGIFTYLDYQTLPNKLANTTSGPSLIFFDRQAVASNLYLWPPPTNGGTLNITAARSANDVTDPSQDLDLPIEWQEAAVYNLADRFIDEEGTALTDPATVERITARAAHLYEKVLNFDRPASIKIRPWGKRGAGRMWRG